MLERSQTNEWINKLIYPYSGIQLSRKEGCTTTDTCNNTDASQTHYTK